MVAERKYLLIVVQVCVAGKRHINLSIWVCESGVNEQSVNLRHFSLEIEYKLFDPRYEYLYFTSILTTSAHQTHLHVHDFDIVNIHHVGGAR